MTRCAACIPVFNQRSFIDRAVRSVFEQGFDPGDVTIVDNCSSDGTWEAIQQYASMGARLVRNTRNLGLFGNFKT